MATENAIKPEEALNVWGIASAIDIYDCAPEKIRAFAQGYFGGSFSSINVTLRH